MLGKRKRDARVVSRPTENKEITASTPIETNEATQDIFRRHFEAIFEPLPEEKIDQANGENSDSEKSSDTRSEVSEWSGLSETTTQPPVIEVVSEVVLEEDGDAEFHRARQKAFMSSRPPREIDTVTKGSKTPKSTEEDDLTEKVNLKHDLDLQRLLKESHLIERSRSAAAIPGRERQMALDMRLQALGAKESIYTQRDMPRSHRIGMNKKAESKEAMRRREAKENGIVLEKVAGLKKKKGAGGSQKRVRGVDAPGVGKFSGGTLKLSRSDVASIQGTRSGGTNGRGRRGKRS